MLKSNSFISRKFFIPFFAVLFLILFDQAIKILVLVLNVSHTCNGGFAFGIGSQVQANTIFAVPVILLFFVFYFLLKEKRQFYQFGYLLIIAGGVSNLIDRIIRGCVVDFISFGSVLNFAFLNSAFNPADIFVTIGIGIVIFGIIFGTNEK